MGEAALLLADTPRKVTPFGDFSILWPALWVVGALLLGALIINYAKLWRQRPVSFHLSASEQLAHFRLLYESGKLSPEEFQRIEARLSQRLKREMNLPASPPADASTAVAASGVDKQKSEERPLPPVGIAKTDADGPEAAETNGQPASEPGEPNIPKPP